MQAPPPKRARTNGTATSEKLEINEVVPNDVLQMVSCTVSRFHGFT